MSRFKIGERVWNIGSNWIELEEVEIVSQPAMEVNKEFVYYKIKGIDFPGTSATKETDLFKRKEEAIKEIKRRKNERVEKISNEIYTVEDLLNMMFESMHCEEYTDWEKIEVAKRKSKELLGVELKRQ